MSTIVELALLSESMMRSGDTTRLDDFLNVQFAHFFSAIKRQNFFVN